MPLEAQAILLSKRRTLLAITTLVNPNAHRVCEVGFFVGHFAATALSVLHSASEFLLFDNFAFPGGDKGLAYLRHVFNGSVTFSEQRGDSKTRVPAWAAAHPGERCDVIHIDGDHAFEGVQADVANLQALAHPGTLVIMDDCHCGAAAPWCIGPTRAYDEAVAAGVLTSAAPELDGRITAYIAPGVTGMGGRLNGKGSCFARFVPLATKANRARRQRLV
jgi:hypothetical protein